MRRILAIVFVLLLALFAACAENAETVILLADEGFTVNGEAIRENADAGVYLTHKTETHADVPEEYAGVANRVVVIAQGGVYRVKGQAENVQLMVQAGAEDEVRLILDGVSLVNHTSPAILIAGASDPRTPGEYGVCIELADGSENTVAGSHTVRIQEDDVKYDGAIDSLVSLGFEGEGSLTVDADNEGIEVKFGHMTIQSGTFIVEAGDDPLNVSEDGVGTLTVNGGNLFSSVKPAAGGEGDGIDSNGYIVFNGGTVINLAHPTSQDSGIDSDMGSIINGGLIVGAGNMYDPIDEGSEQLFMLLEFDQATNDLIVVTDEQGKPVFAYDFPYDYMYIAFSTPELSEETYFVYMGGEIEGVQRNGLYTEITSYTPGTRMVHGGGNAQARNNPMQGMEMGGMTPPDGMQQGGRDFGGFFRMIPGVDLNELLKDKDLNELLKGKDLNSLLTGFALTDLFTEEEIREYFGEIDFAAFDKPQDQPGGFGGMRMPGGLQSSSDTATEEFRLSRENTGFTKVTGK